MAKKYFDPFKSDLPKWHFSRWSTKLYTQFHERRAIRRFGRDELPCSELEDLPHMPEVKWEDTAVTKLQMQYLLAGLKMTEQFSESTVVELGSYRCLHILKTWCFFSAIKRADILTGMIVVKHDVESQSIFERLLCSSG